MFFTLNIPMANQPHAMKCAKIVKVAIMKPKDMTPEAM